MEAILSEWLWVIALWSFGFYLIWWLFCKKFCAGVSSRRRLLGGSIAVWTIFGIIILIPVWPVNEYPSSFSNPQEWVAFPPDPIVAKVYNNTVFIGVFWEQKSLVRFWSENKYSFYVGLKGIHQSQGMGIRIKNYILTAGHVAYTSRRFSEKAWLFFYDNEDQNWHPASLVFLDRKNDIAILDVGLARSNSLPLEMIGNSDKIKDEKIYWFGYDGHWKNPLKVQKLGHFIRFKKNSFSFLSDEPFRARPSESGSPIFTSKKHKLIGFLTKGTRTGDKCEGVPINLVLSQLNAAGINFYPVRKPAP